MNAARVVLAFVLAAALWAPPRRLTGSPPACCPMEGGAACCPMGGDVTFSSCGDRGEASAAGLLPYILPPPSVAAGPAPGGRLAIAIPNRAPAPCIDRPDPPPRG